MRALLFPGALKNYRQNKRTVGYTIALRNGYYRNYSLSCIEKLHIAVDGAEIAPEKLKFILNGKTYLLEQLKDQYMEYWDVMEPAYVFVPCDGGLAEGMHKVAVELRIRVAYVPMPFSPETRERDHSYWVPVYTEEKSYVIEEGEYAG